MSACIEFGKTGKLLVANSGFRLRIVDWWIVKKWQIPDNIFHIRYKYSRNEDMVPAGWSLKKNKKKAEMQEGKEEDEEKNWDGKEEDREDDGRI